MSNEKAVSLTADDLKSLFKEIAASNREDLIAVLAEVRKPKDPTPAELAAQAQDEAMRKDRADLELTKREGWRIAREQCPHRQQNGSAAVAQVQGISPYANTDFLICVKCQAKIKPAVGPFDEIEGDYIYDKQLYYALIGALPQTTF